MKTVSTLLATHLAGTVTTLATCWKVTRKDSTVLGFTDHDEDIVVDGVTYEAATGYTRSAIQSQSDLSVDNLEIDGLLDGAAITADDIRAGVYDSADVRVFIVNWASPTDGTIALSRGFIGDVSVRGELFVAEQRSLKQALDVQFLRVYTPECDADLGDARCTFNVLGSGTEAGTVTAVTDARRVFSVTGPVNPDLYFAGGFIQFETGDNAAPRPPVEVRSKSGGTITLYLPIGFDIQVGDTFLLSFGCDKTAATCKARFSNLANFRGFPFIPGLDKALETPNAV